MRLLVLAAAALLGGGPGAQTIAGTISANTGSSVTVSTADRSLTCAVLGTHGQAAILRWGTGVRAGMACRQSNGKLVLWKLVRLDSKEKPKPTTTTPDTTTPDTTTPDTTTPGTTTTAPPQLPASRQAAGVVVGLRTDGVAVKPDAGGETLTCAVTAAPDSTHAAATLSLGAHVAIVCRLDGGRYVLAGATPLG